MNAQKINPLDLQPRKAIGVKLPFSGKAVFNSTFISADAIKTNLINFFLTARGERYLNPDFGNGLQALLFDQLTEDKLREINSLIKEDLKFYFPRVIATDMAIEGIPDRNTVQFVLKYKVDSTNIEDELVINFDQ